MHIKINPTSYERCYPSRLKKIFQSDLNYSTYSDFVTKSGRQIVGNIPSEIIKLFEKNNKAYKIKDFQSALAELTNYMRYTFKRLQVSKPGFVDFRKLSSLELAEFENHTSFLFNKRVEKLMPAGYKFRIQYVDRGAFKSVFRLSLYDKDYKKVMHDKAWQVFFNKDIKIRNLSSEHNNYAEANFWIFIKNAIGHKMDKSQFTKHYISDMQSAYAITEFADNSIHPTTSVFPYSKFGIYWCDSSKYNRPKYEKLYDGGGFEKMKNFMGDKIVRKFFKRLINANSEKDFQIRMNDVQKLIDNPKTPNRDKIIKAVNIYKSVQ